MGVGTKALHNLDRPYVQDVEEEKVYFQMPQLFVSPMNTVWLIKEGVTYLKSENPLLVPNSRQIPSGENCAWWNRGLWKSALRTGPNDLQGELRRGSQLGKGGEEEANLSRVFTVALLD